MEGQTMHTISRFAVAWLLTSFATGPIIGRFLRRQFHEGDQ